MNIQRYSDVFFSIRNLIIMIILLSSLLTLLVLNNLPEDNKSKKIMDSNCLKEKTEPLCELGAIQIDDESFRCVIQDYPRKRTIEMTSKIYFTDREIRDCTIIELNNNGGK